MGRGIAGVIGGLIAWFLVATIGNMLLRLWPGYAAAEILTTFTFAMMTARLSLSAFSSIGAGYAVAWITKVNGRAVKVLGLVLTMMFLPVHYALWDKFPVWYHGLFLLSLLPLTFLGGALFAQRGPVSRHS